jgi:leucyl/phenylalanyl-tRNA--protein transferase
VNISKNKKNIIEENFFPPVEQALENGLLCMGGPLNPRTLQSAYQKGIYPWPNEEFEPVLWFSPDPRGILKYSNLHVSTSLKKFIKKNTDSLKIVFNGDFERVIYHCAHRTEVKGEFGTWITEDLMKAYFELFKLKKAYCVETFLNGELIGGLYGVNINQYVSGESMFFLKPNGSKVSLVALLTFLQSQNIHWIDTQMVTPIVEQLGGEEISRNDFLVLLKAALDFEVEVKTSSPLQSIFYPELIFQFDPSNLKAMS